jgi:hypothetical protein
MSTVEPMVLRDCKSLIVPRPRLHPWWSGLGANGRAMLAAAGTVQVSRRAQTCSLSHFAMKLFFAAPASGLPSDPIALGSHASPLHLAMKLFFAAPASGSSTCTKYRAIQEVRL